MTVSGKPHRRNREPLVTIEVQSSDVDRRMVDMRPRKCNQSLGTIRECCSQYGISISVATGKAVLKAPRNRMQLFLERLHYAGVKYAITKRG